jgi:signal transduction histidine kinase
MRLKRLLLNVVSNAVKFTGDNGCIRVSAHRTGAGDLMVEIKDDGCGIEPEMMDRVFEPFTRIGRAEGSGLGLHIARGLARLHGGELTLTSVPGAGTTATLGLPKSRLIEPPT